MNEWVDGGAAHGVICMRNGVMRLTVTKVSGLAPRYQISASISVCE